MPLIPIDTEKVYLLCCAVSMVLPLVLYLFIVGLFAVYQAERVAVGANDLPITDLLKGRTGVAMLGWWQ